MKTILIVEDDQEKVRAICLVIESVPGLGGCEIKRASSTNEAVEILGVHQVDVMILDLVIPLRMTDDPKPENAVDLLEIIRSRKGIKKPLVVIGTTQHDDALREWQKKFEEGLWVLLLTSDGNQDWEGRLRLRLSYLIESLEQWRTVAMQRSSVDVCIVTAVAIETEHVHREFAPRAIPREGDSSVYYQANITNRLGKSVSVLCVESDSKGMTAAASITTKVIYEFRPKILIMCGIAAGVSGKARIGDVLAPASMIDYVSGKIRANKKEGETFVGDASVLNIPPRWKGVLTDLTRNKNFLSEITADWGASRPYPDPHLIVGPLASGSAVIQSDARVAELLNRFRDVVGIDMEAYGVLHAAQTVGGVGPETFCFKAVSDLGTTAKNNKWQAYAAFMGARFSKEFIVNHVLV